MSDAEAPWSRGLFAPSPVSVPDEALSLYAETIRQRQEIERLEAEVAELAEENALIRKLANKYLAESTALKAEVERLREALERIDRMEAYLHEDHRDLLYSKLASCETSPAPPSPHRRTLMPRETKPCPVYGMPCEYVPMAERADAYADEITRLRSALNADDQTLRLHLGLHLGEMTAQEMRTLRAGFSWVLARAALTQEKTDV
jgi:hypothetical protein